MISLDERLNAALDRMASDELLHGRGLGNEIAFYIFDYPPDQELKVRGRTGKLVEELRHRKPELRVVHVNLFKLIIDHLKERRLLEKAIELERKKGSAEMLKALAAPLRADRIAEVFAASTKPLENDLVIVSGIGSAYPLLRSHALLNNLHTVMGMTPLVMFFPGTFSGQSLRLFNKLEDENYYRAFRLVP